MPRLRGIAVEGGTVRYGKERSMIETKQTVRNWRSCSRDEGPHASHAVLSSPSDHQIGDCDEMRSSLEPSSNR